jgi:hypothetical protein
MCFTAIKIEKNISHSYKITHTWFLSLNNHSYLFNAYFILGEFLSRDDPSVINISDEMSKTALWRNLLITADNSKDKESSFPSKRFEF